MILKINGVPVDNIVDTVDFQQLIDEGKVIVFKKREDVDQWLKNSRFKYKNLDEIERNKNRYMIQSSPLAGLILAYMGISHYIALGVVAFAGTAWMLGHRTKAVELLIGVSLGYLIILHAPDFIAFLETVSKSHMVIK